MAGNKIDHDTLRGLTGNWLQTLGGHKFHFGESGGAHNIYIEDIAASLSKTCRYNGHCDGFYSVAQHSVIMSHLVKPEHAKWGLLHDAAEAYIGDIVTPLKRAIRVIMDLEEEILKSVAKTFGLEYPIPPEVMEMDRRLLATEKAELIDHISYVEWESLKGVEPAPIKNLTCWGWYMSHQEFMRRFNELFLSE